MRIVLTFVLIFNITIGNCQKTIDQRRVRLNLINNSYSDYLFYLLFRESYPHYKIDRTGIIEDVPTLHNLVSLPEIVASNNVKSYDEIYKAALIFKNAQSLIIQNPYPKILSHSFRPANYDTMMSILKAGEKYYDKFYKIWVDRINPGEQENIRVWRIQDSLYHPFEKLINLTRIKFKSKQLDVACIALHLSGSGNYSPAGVYTTGFKDPLLPWVLGHEGTHLLVTKYYGVDWHQHALYSKALSLAKKYSFQVNDFEEMLCIFMQVELSRACGLEPNNYLISDAFKSDKVKYGILKEMENKWNVYQTDPKKYKNIIDFMLLSGIAAVDRMAI